MHVGPAIPDVGIPLHNPRFSNVRDIDTAIVQEASHKAPVGH